ncbi:MAG: DUF134 domain-containing protein [Thermoactinomyces sp.]
MTREPLVASVLKRGWFMMPRPRKWRRVCSLPDANQFGPLDLPEGKDNFIQMTVDEYETIRLIDLEGLTQAECASRMDIARTTVQGIYNHARKKLADALVNGKVLRIGGGEYKFCDGKGKFCHKGGCRRRKRNRCHNHGESK